MEAGESFKEYRYSAWLVFLLHVFFLLSQQFALHGTSCLLTNLYWFNKAMGLLGVSSQMPFLVLNNS